MALGLHAAAAASIERARLVAETDEDRARVEALTGNHAHFAGDPARALASFRRAADHAAYAGAVLEEATYLTGIAAEASNAGELELALSSGLRAVLLFEGLGRKGEAARALLSLASAHASLGSVTLAREHARAAIRRARDAGDKRCRAYAHLILSDTSPPDDREGLEHARYAASLLDPDPDDRLRVQARLHERGEQVELDALDSEATASERALDVRLEWWSARARRATLDASPVRAERVVDAPRRCAARRRTPEPSSRRVSATATPRAG
jgi:hypothetical protein